MNLQKAAIARGMLSPEEAGARLGISGKTIKDHAKRKEITMYRFGYRTYRFKVSDVDIFLEKMKV